MSVLKLVSSHQESPTVVKSKGFILQHQTIDDQSWSGDPHCMLVVQFLIRKASYKPHTIQYGKHEIALNVGEYATTNLKLAKSSAVYGLYKSSKNPDEAAKSAVKAVLKTLEADNFLSKRVIGKGKDQCTVITIKNWAKFQSKNASVLKPLTKPLAKPQEKPIQSHIEKGAQLDTKPIAEPIAEPLTNPNNNKGSKQQEKDNAGSETQRDKFLEIREDAFEHFWKTWSEAKKLINRKNTSSKSVEKAKFMKTFPASKVRRLTQEQFDEEINEMCELAWHAHSDIANSIANGTRSDWYGHSGMYPSAFMTKAQWREDWRSL